MNKKIIAVALALLIMTVALVGCSKNNAEQTTTTTAPTSSTTETTSDIGANVPEWITDVETTTNTSGSEEEPSSSASGETTTKGGIQIGDDPNSSGHVEYTGPVNVG